MEKEELETKKESTDPSKSIKLFSYIKEYFAIYMTFSILVCAAIGYYGEYTLLKEFGLNIIVFAEIDDFFLASLKNPLIFILNIFFPFIVAVSMYLISHAAKYSIPIEEQLDDLKKFEPLKKQRKTVEIEMNWIEKEISAEIQALNNLSFANKYLEIIAHPIYYFKLRRNIKLLKINRENWISSEDNFREIDQAYVFLKKAKLFYKIAIPAIGILLGIYISIINIILEINLKETFERVVNNPDTMVTINLRNNKTIPDSLCMNQPVIFITATSKFMFFYQHGRNNKVSTLSIPISSIESVLYADYIQPSVYTEEQGKECS